ncbi:MAG TPA: LysR family transcriptional regulator substrate-binding protein [Agromyces mariniharenae]|nr:LysR family transcriptional regulator substrate-binding protein [Agromyces mariniharenae]
MTLRLRYVAGVSPAKWLRAWSERRPDLPLEAARVEQSEQLVEVLTGDADLAFVRLPVDAAGLPRIPLWEEVAVAVLPKDHPLADAAALTLADLEGEHAAPAQPDPALTVELVAAGTGYAILPHGLARLHHRRDVTAVPVTDAAPTRIALDWRVERDDADIQEFVGVVRGRTTRSSRGDAGDDDATGSSPGTSKPAAGQGSAKGSAKGGAGKAGGKGRGTGRAASARSGRTARKRGGRGR